MGLDYSDTRPLYFNSLNLKLRAENIGHGLEYSRAAGGCNRGAAVEADAIGELQLKRTQSVSSGHNREVAAEADTIGEQQLCTESCPAPDYSRRQTRGK